MQEVLNWTINTIRNEKSIDSTWLEEKKFEWTPLVVKSLKSLLEHNSTILIITDDSRQWFSQYILANINNPKNNRPYLPFYDLKSICTSIDKIKSEEDIQLILDMLNISFPNGYVFWYIGDGNSTQSILPKYNSNSFMWLLDEELPNSLSLKDDEQLDLKLLQIFNLFNKTLEAVLFADINLDS